MKNGQSSSKTNIENEACFVSLTTQIIFAKMLG